MIYCQIPERKPTVHIEELTVFVLSPRETVFSVLEIFIKAFLFKLGYNHSLLKKTTMVCSYGWGFASQTKALDKHLCIYSFGIGVAATAILSIAHSSVPRRILK